MDNTTSHVEEDKDKDEEMIMTENNNTNNPSSSSATTPLNRRSSSSSRSDSFLDRIQSDLQTVETSLRGAAAQDSSSSSYGRTFLDSIRTTLTSIRERLNSSATSTSTSTSTTQSDTNSNTTRRGLLRERLHNAEMAHSNRMPLHYLPELLSSRQPAMATAAAATSATSSTTTTPTTDRRQSLLLASRRLSEAALRRQADMDLLCRSSAAMSNTNVAALEEQDEQEQEEEQDAKIKGTIDTKMKDIMEEETRSVDDNDEIMQEQEEEEREEAPSTPETPILLTEQSHANLDAARRSVLFASDTLRREQQDSQKAATTTTTAVSSNTAVYSWGEGIQSLHDEAQDVPLEKARVHAADRVGRYDILSASVSSQHAACSTASGQVLVCGHNNQDTGGAVLPDQKDCTVIAKPVILESLARARIVQVSCGRDHTAAIRVGGIVMTWGSNEFGQLGHRLLPISDDDDDDIDMSWKKKQKQQKDSFCGPAAMVLGAGRRATLVSCGDGFTLVLTSRMELLACGVECISGYCRTDSAAGDVGGGVGSGEERRELPACIPALEDLPLVTVAAGRRHAVVLTAHGSAFCWGENSYGCCGRDYPKQSHVPVPIRVPATTTTSEHKHHHHLPQEEGATLLLSEPLSNWVYCKGGEGGGGDHSRVALADDVAVVDAAAGDEHTILVTRSGRLLVCGSNSHGQLGLDRSSIEAVHSLKPVEHPGAASGRHFVRAEAGEAHSLVLDDIGDVWQLGGDISASGPQRVLKGKFIQWIAAGGRQNIAVAAAPHRRLPQREFSNSSETTLADSLEELLRALPDDKKVKNNEGQDVGVAAAELASRTEELLRTPAVLNSLFLDPNELDDLFTKIIGAETKGFRQTIASAIEKGIQRGLDTIYSHDTRLIYPEQVRFLLLYIQCPLFSSWKDSDVFFDRRGDLILLLCETILSLSYEGYRALLSWATSIYPRETFVRLLINPLLAQLEKSLSVAAGAETRPIPAIVTVLKWLYNASERCGSIAKPEDFHSSAVARLHPELLLNDLIRFKKANKEQRATDFFFCDNAFIFSPTAKRNLLEIENEMLMLRTAASSGMTYNVEQRAFEIDPFYVLVVDREHLLEQTLQRIGKAESTDLRKKLRVVFNGEEGVDAGGVTREYFQLLSTHLFDVNTGMWSVRFDEQITWFNSDCFWNDERFFLSGILVGLAVYNSVLLDVNFPQAVYRKLLGLPLGLEDMVDAEIKSSLQTLLDYEGDDVEDIFCISFDVNWMDLGTEKVKELKPGGSNIPVTAENKEEYVVLYVKWLLVDSIYPQYDAFERGFMRVMEDSTLNLLRPEDLELLVAGTPELDFDALENNTVYEGYDSESPVVRSFWRFIKNSSSDTQLSLLKFATGSPKAPIGGLGALPFKIQRAGPDSEQLPTSHTCFNTLLLPDYGENYKKLEELLGRAILECEGFGLM